MTKTDFLQPARKQIQKSMPSVQKFRKKKPTLQICTFSIFYIVEVIEHFFQPYSINADLQQTQNRQRHVLIVNKIFFQLFFTHSVKISCNSSTGK